MVGYAFLKSASKHVMAGRSDLYIAMARTAAQSGLTHAVEQILADYNQASLDVATGSGVQTVTDPPTFLDGPYRAPFTSLSKPNVLNYTQQDALDWDDVQSESPLVQAYATPIDQYYVRWHEYMASYKCPSGMAIYDGRGRYIEANRYNSQRQDPGAANPVPVAPLPFTDLTSANVADHENGLYLDDTLCRLTSGSAQQRRQAARYRLRYAVGIEDLNGHLLINPRASMNVDWTDPVNDYRVIPNWLDYSGYVLENMAMPISYWSNKNPQYSRTASLRIAHIFRGRGNATNVDRTVADGKPAVFPQMFRSTEKDMPFWLTGSANRRWWGWFTYDKTSYTTGGTLFGFDNSADPTFPAITPSAAGGQVLTPVGQPWSWPYAHAKMGPQYSWWDLLFSLRGTRYPSSTYQLGKDDPDRDGAYTDLLEPRINQAMSWSLFGRPLEHSSAAPNTWKWYQGRVNTPWQVNLLTATPQTISQMLSAYLPPYLKRLHWVKKEYYRRIGTVNGLDTYDTVPYQTSTIDITQQLPGLDILNGQACSGLSEFPVPDGGGAVSPNYYLPDTRTLTQCYPGELLRGDRGNGGLDPGEDANGNGVLDPGEDAALSDRLDDVGRYIDVDTGYGGAPTPGRCSTTLNPLLFTSGSDYSWTEDDPISAPPGNRTLVVQRLDPDKWTYKYSYFLDMVTAMTFAAAYARATWVQYPNEAFDPRTGFADPSLRDPLKCRTIEDIDRLFLREMGESMDNPGLPCADNPLVFSLQGNKAIWQVYSRPVSNTIKSLVTKDLIKTSGVSSAERAKVMERMLNDFRMSFLGSSPKYGDFRPLDFDGDTEVQCSCYDQNVLERTAAEQLYRTDRWKRADASGRGPAPTPYSAFPAATGSNPWFSFTGCFYIGKSRFYRVFVRGSIYDNLYRKPLAQETLESVLTVDPEGMQFGGGGSAEQRLLYFRWLESQDNATLPLHNR